MTKKGLGKGLGALLGDRPVTDVLTPVNEPQNGETVTEIKLSDIEPNKEQPRQSFDDEKIAELASSIEQYGVISPIIVVKSDNGFYKIVAGERRWRASKKAGLKKIPAIIKEFSDIEISQVALVENLQRQDLNPIEEAMGYKKLIDDYSLTQEEVAEKVGKSRSAVTNSLRILSLPDDVVELVKNGKLSLGHAKVILSVSGRDKQSEIAKIVVDNDLSVRATESLVKKKPQKSKSTQNKDLNMRLAFKDYEKSLSQTLGAKVKICDKGNKGTIQIEYYSKEELLRISDILNKK